MIIIGSGTWQTAVYDQTTRVKIDTGQAFQQNSLHPSLNPKDIQVRESRDSADHPTSVPIIVLFDVTGSMGVVPRELQKALPELLGKVLTKGVEHPQIMFGAIGDAYSDRVPFQCGQFESDNRMDEDLDNLFLEGNGGGQGMESYELGFYFLARKTATDAFDKRGKKGHAFLIGDEKVYPEVKIGQVSQVFGDDLTENIKVETIVAEAQEKWNIHFVIPVLRERPGNRDHWKDVVGAENVLSMQDSTEIAEIIANSVVAAEAV